MSYEIKRSLSGEIDFSALRRQCDIVISPLPQSDLVDMRLAFYAMPATDPLTPGSGLTGVSDLRVYISGADVTPDVITELGDALRGIPADQLQQQYTEGAAAYMRLMECYGTHQNETRSDRDMAGRIAQDVLAAWRGLGDRSAGWSGNLHPLCFLYRYIRIPPLSAVALWRRYRARTGLAVGELADLPRLVVTVSQGPASWLEPFDPAAIIPSGCLAYSIEIISKNPLEPKLVEIASRLAALSRSMDAIRLNYLVPIADNVSAVQQEARAGLGAVEGTLAEVKAAVDRISP